METNPAIYISLLGTVLTLLSVFGVTLTEGKMQAIMGVATVAIPLVVGIITRSYVYPLQSVQTALNMPQGSSVKLLDRALAADVSVFAGDTKADVVKKVESVERDG